MARPDQSRLHPFSGEEETSRVPSNSPNRYAKLARPGEADDLRARAADSWADELSSGGALEKAAAQYREAAAAYLALAGTATEPADKCRAYRRAAERYFRAKDYPAALAALEPYRRIETAPEALAESWLLAAQVYRN